MLGRTANGLFWMARYMERAENTARLLDAGLRIALTRTGDASGEWESVLNSAGVAEAFRANGRQATAETVADFLLRAPESPSCVLNTLRAARDNGRMVRTALTRDAWESLNAGWLNLRERLSAPFTETDLPEVLSDIKRETALFRGMFYGTALRNENYSFARLGTYVERADNTSRIIDVKYYVLLPSFSRVGSSLDNYHWEAILRSVSAHRAFAWAYNAEPTPVLIADFLILNKKMPRSLAACYQEITHHLGLLGEGAGCHKSACEIAAMLESGSIDTIFAEGLHEFLTDFVQRNNALSSAIATTYRFIPD